MEMDFLRILSTLLLFAIAGIGSASEPPAVPSTSGSADLGAGQTKVEALVGELVAFKNKPPELHALQQVTRILRTLEGMPLDVPLPMAEVVRTLPYKQERWVAEAYVALATRRKAQEAVPDLLAYLEHPPAYSSVAWHAQWALLNMDSPEIVLKTRNELKRLGRPLPESVVLERLEALKDIPAKQRKDRRRIEFRERSQELEDRNFQRLAELKRTNPDGYDEAMTGYLDAKQALQLDFVDILGKHGLLTDTANERERFADRLRFESRKPAHAITQMQAAVALRQKLDISDHADSSLWIADTYRYDLGDTAQALKHYRSALEEAKREAGHEFQEIWRATLRAWLPHEIRYLESGKSFSGTLTAKEAAGLPRLVLQLGGLRWRTDEGASSPVVEVGEQRYELQLERASVSQIGLIRIFFVLATEPNADNLLRYLERCDPARWLTALIFAGGTGIADVEDLRFGLIEESRGALPDNREAFFKASRRFRERHGVRFEDSAAD